MNQKRDDASTTNSSLSSSPPNSDSAFGLGVLPEDGPFMEGVHQTRPVLWVSVLLIFLGVSSLGACVISLHYAGSALGWSTFIGGLVLLLAGIGLAVRNKMGSDVT